MERFTAQAKQAADRFQLWLLAMGHQDSFKHHLKYDNSMQSLLWILL